MNPLRTALPLEQMLDRRRHAAVVRGVVGRTEHVGHSICDTVGAHLIVRSLYTLCTARVQSIVARIGPHHRFAPLLLLSSLVKEERTHLHLLTVRMDVVPRYPHGVIHVIYS
jgi:hypothetical protein